MVFLLIIYLLILAFLSLNPWFLPSSNRVAGFVAWDQLGHGSAYAVLSVLMIVAIRKWQRPTAVKFLVVLLVSGLIGAFFEFCQDWFTTTRQFSIYDIVANFFGSVFGLLFVGFLVITGLWGKLQRLAYGVSKLYKS